MDDGKWKQKQIVTKDSKSFVALVASEVRKGKKDRYCFFPSLSHCIILQNKNNRVKSFKKVKMPIEGKGRAIDTRLWEKVYSLRAPSLVITKCLLTFAS